MTDDLRRTAQESQRERVHRLASLGGLVVLAGLDGLPPDLLLGAFLEVSDRMPQLSGTALAQSASREHCAYGSAPRKSARGRRTGSTPIGIAWS
jgi:hypothetical protein